MSDSQRVYCPHAPTCPETARCQRKFFVGWRDYCPRITELNASRVLPATAPVHTAPPAAIEETWPVPARVRALGLPLAPGAQVHVLRENDADHLYVPLADGRRLILSPDAEDEVYACGHR